MVDGKHWAWQWTFWVITKLPTNSLGKVVASDSPFQAPNHHVEDDMSFFSQKPPNRSSEGVQPSTTTCHLHPTPSSPLHKGYVHPVIHPISHPNTTKKHTSDTHCSSYGDSTTTTPNVRLQKQKKDLAITIKIPQHTNKRWYPTYTCDAPINPTKTTITPTYNHDTTSLVIIGN